MASNIISDRSINNISTKKVLHPFHYKGLGEGLSD
jgi:hypothetical protein